MTLIEKFYNDCVYYQEKNGVIYHGDCLSVLKNFPDNSIDAVITDPPYGLSDHDEKTIRDVLLHWLNGDDDYIPKKKGFMGASWDAFVPPPALWKEVFRVMKPGANIMVFAGSRTQDLMTMALRLAGFEIRDVILFLHGQGFPKGIDISKQIDKRLGAEREVIGRYVDAEGRVYKQTGNRRNFTAGNKEEVDICDDKRFLVTAPATPEAKLWEGYRTALKPAYEPIIWAIKPCDGSFANNALKWGVAGLWIDGCRIGSDVIKTHGKRNGSGVSLGWCKYKSPENYKVAEHLGRYPANIVLECICDEVIKKDGAKFHTNPECVCYMLDQQFQTAKGWGKSTEGNLKGKSSLFKLGGVNPNRYDMGGTGASRFFYCAKADRKERNIGCEDLPKRAMTELNKIGGEKSNFKTGSGNERDIYLHNNHPTVKPLDLCRYLVKLILMPNPEQTYLDPFLGSGTIAMAVKEHGRNWIGIELNKDYCEIAKRRIAAISSYVSLF